MATHSSVLAWRIPGTGEPGGLPSMGSHRVGHDWSDLAAAAESSGVSASLLLSCLYLNARLLFPTGTSGPTPSCLTLFLALSALFEIKSKLYQSGSQSSISLCLYFLIFIAWLHQCVVVQSVESEVAQSCPTVCDPMGCSLPGSSVHGIFQARVLEWVAISFSSASKWKVKVKSLSHVGLFTTPWAVAYQAPPSMGFSRQEYWSGVPLPSLYLPLVPHIFAFPQCATLDIQSFPLSCYFSKNVLFFCSDACIRPNSNHPFELLITEDSHL